MSWITRPGSAVSIAILLALFATVPALAQKCDFSGNWPLPLTCQPGFVGGYCAVQYCNADTDCRNDRPVLLVLASLFATPREIVRVGKSAFLVKPTGSARRAQRLVAAALATQLVTMWKAASAAQYALSDYEALGVRAWLKVCKSERARDMSETATVTKCDQRSESGCASLG